MKWWSQLDSYWKFIVICVLLNIVIWGFLFSVGYDGNDSKSYYHDSNRYDHPCYYRNIYTESLNDCRRRIGEID